MIIAIIFIVLGIFLLLNALGIIVGNFWGFFWAIIFLAIGFKLLRKKGICPMCAGSYWADQFHDSMHDECCGEDGCDCDECEDCEDEAEDIKEKTK
jgi:hypothetical protein